MKPPSVPPPCRGPVAASVWRPTAGAQEPLCEAEPRGKNPRKPDTINPKSHSSGAAQSLSAPKGWPWITPRMAGFATSTDTHTKQIHGTILKPHLVP